MTFRFVPAPSVSAAVGSRFSVRAFLGRPVDGGMLRDILRRASRSPSGGNLQPWRIVVLGGNELNAFKTAVAERLKTAPTPDPELYPIYPPELGEPYRSNRFRCGEMLYGLLGVPREQKAERMQWFQRNYTFFGAPVGLLCYVDRCMGSAQWSDLGMYLQTLMLLLREQGLDSCPQECWSVYHRTVEQFVQQAPELTLFCGMAIGYADPEAAVNRLETERLPLEQFATFRGI